MERPPGLTQHTWEAWQRKRRHTLIGTIMIGVTIGIDCSIVMSTLFYYLRDLVKTDQPKLWYGLIIACFFVSSTVCGGVAGRWLDRTRRVTVYVKFSLLFQVHIQSLYSLRSLYKKTRPYAGK